jgi:flagellar protein FliO/FliZ
LVLGRGKLKIPVFALLLLGAGLSIQITPIFAQEEVSPVESPLREAELAISLEDNTLPAASITGPTTGAVVRMVLTLALAAAAVYGIVFFIKKSVRHADVKDPFLKILAGAHLGSNRYAHIVSVGSRAWLLGSSDGGVNLIGEIDDKDVLNAMLLEDSRKSAESPAGRFPDFASLLRRLGTPVEFRPPGADGIRKRRERLKGL